MIKNGSNHLLKIMIVIKNVEEQMDMYVQDYINLNAVKDIGVYKMINFMMYGIAEMDCINYSYSF
jgi:hypothetical protein